MLSGTTLRASAMAGTAVFRIVVSNDSIKNATATSHGSNRLPELGDERAAVGLGMAAKRSRASVLPQSAEHMFDIRIHRSLHGSLIAAPADRVDVPIGLKRSD